MAQPLKLSFSNRLSSQGLEADFSTNSAQLAKAEREIKELKEENEALKKKFSDISSLYTQLMDEKDHENYDRWRIMLLKSQIIQLERQVMLLTDALGSRSHSILDVENSLAAAGDLCRSVLMQNEKMSLIKLQRSDFERLLQTIESSRLKLFKNTEINSVDNVRQPLTMMLNRFVRNKSDKEAVSLMDVCSGQTGHINLKHVSQLESSLMNLYKQLMLVASLLHGLTSAATTQNVPEAVYVRLAGHVAKACDMLKTTNQQLLQLSVLVPAAPLPTFHDPFAKQLNAEDVLRAFQRNKSQNKLKDMRHLVNALLKAMNYSVYMAGTEKELLLDELKFHQSIYDLQSCFGSSLVSHVRKEYLDFESDLKVMICRPVKEILDSFETLKDGRNDKSVQQFFRVFKSHADQLAETVKSFSADDCDREDREDSLSLYGKQFFEDLSLACLKFRQERDRRLNEIDSVRAEQMNHLVELRKLFPAAAAAGSVSRDDVKTPASAGVRSSCTDRKASPAASESGLPPSADTSDAGEWQTDKRQPLQKQFSRDLEKMEWDNGAAMSIRAERMETRDVKCSCGEIDSDAQQNEAARENMSCTRMTTWLTGRSHNGLDTDGGHGKTVNTKKTRKDSGATARSEPLVALAKLKLRNTCHQHLQQHLHQQLQSERRSPASGNISSSSFEGKLVCRK